MNQKINKLSKTFEQMGFNIEAQAVQGLITTTWQDVLNEVNKPAEAQIQEVAIKSAITHIGSGIRSLVENASKLENFAEDEIAKIMPYIGRFLRQSKEEQDKLIKEAGFGGIILGPVIDVLSGIKNIHYGLQEYEKLTNNAQKLGLKWWNTLDSSALMEKVSQYQNSPADIKLLANTAKSAKILWDEAISLAFNSVSAIKNTLMLFVKLVPGVILADIGITGLYMLYQHVLTKGATKGFDKVLDSIKTLAEKNLQEATPTIADELPDWLKELSGIMTQPMSTT